MKAELYDYGGKWLWRLSYNGKTVAWGRFYSRKDSAKRGLKSFLSNVFNNHLSLWEQADGKFI